MCGTYTFDRFVLGPVYFLHTVHDCLQCAIQERWKHIFAEFGYQRSLIVISARFQSCCEKLSAFCKKCWEIERWFLYNCTSEKAIEYPTCVKCEYCSSKWHVLCTHAVENDIHTTSTRELLNNFFLLCQIHRLLIINNKISSKFAAKFCLVFAADRDYSAPAKKFCKLKCRSTNAASASINKCCFSLGKFGNVAQCLVGCDPGFWYGSGTDQVKVCWQLDHMTLVDCCVLRVPTTVEESTALA